jgi:hypothetical protein
MCVHEGKKRWRERERERERERGREKERKRERDVFESKGWINAIRRTYLKAGMQNNTIHDGVLDYV